MPIFRALQVLLVPSAFTVATGRAHWEVLLRARAIETQVRPELAAWTECVVCRRRRMPALACPLPPLTTPRKAAHKTSAEPPPQSAPTLAGCLALQCYVIAAAQAGRHNEKRESYGHSLIIDPWGEVVGRLDDPLATGIAVAEVDLQRLAGIRQRMPVAEHRALGRPAVIAAPAQGGSTPVAAGEARAAEVEGAAAAAAAAGQAALQEGQATAGEGGT